MKTYMVTLINQNGDLKYFYSKAKNYEHATELGSKEAIRISNFWNNYVFNSAEIFNIKLHARD